MPTMILTIELKSLPTVMRINRELKNILKMSQVGTNKWKNWGPLKTWLSHNSKRGWNHNEKILFILSTNWKSNLKNWPPCIMANLLWSFLLKKLYWKSKTSKSNLMKLWLENNITKMQEINYKKNWSMLLITFLNLKKKFIRQIRHLWNCWNSWKMQK